jgi:site-specific recombinase XerD
LVAEENVKISELLEVMKTTMLLEGLSPTTIQNYEFKVNYAIDHFLGDAEVSELTRRKVEAFVAYHRGKGISANTSLQDVAAFRKLVQVAVREGELPNDFGREIKYPRVVEGLPSPMPVARAVEIVNHHPIRERNYRFVAIRDRTMLALALFTGARAKEVCGLELGDLDLNEDVITFRITKGGKPRIVPIHPELKVQLEVYLKIRLEIDVSIKKLPALFVLRVKRGESVNGWRGLKPYYYSEIFKKHARSLGFGSERAHNMRHTFATTLLQSGADLPTIQHLMGHSDIRTTLKYLKIDASGKRKAVNNLPIKLVPDRND